MMHRNRFMMELERFMLEGRQARARWEAEQRRILDIFIFGHENPTRRERFAMRLTMFYRRIRWWFTSTD